jgi:DNA-binding NarL/FixJ family response regulator
MPRLLIADDHPLFRLALLQIVRDVVPSAELLEADSLAAARAVLAAHADVDLVLLDLHMPDTHGLMGLAALRAEHPEIAVVMISAHDDPRTIARALAYGAAGFIPKRSDVARLRDALQAVLACEDYVPPELQPAVAAHPPAADDAALAHRLASLTAQQFKVLIQVAEGRLNKQIADSLQISERTVKAHLTALFDKLGVRNRTQAGVLLRALELTDPSRHAGD